MYYYLIRFFVFCKVEFIYMYNTSILIILKKKRYLLNFCIFSAIRTPGADTFNRSTNYTCDVSGCPNSSRADPIRSGMKWLERFLENNFIVPDASHFPSDIRYRRAD